jgi:hypothetical protein
MPAREMKSEEFANEQLAATAKGLNANKVVESDIAIRKDGTVDFDIEGVDLKKYTVRKNPTASK